MPQLEQIVYTKQNLETSEEHPCTFVLMVDMEYYEKHKTDKSIPLVQVVDSYTVLKYDQPGKSGKLVRPSQRELQDTFGMTNEDEIVAFIVEHGVPHGKVK